MGKTFQSLVNRVGSDVQYLGQSPRPVQNLYCAQKELVGQASVRVLLRSLGLSNPGGFRQLQGASLYPGGLAVLLGSLERHHPRTMGITFPFSVLCKLVLTLGPAALQSLPSLSSDSILVPFWKQMYYHTPEGPGAAVGSQLLWACFYKC